MVGHTYTTLFCVISRLPVRLELCPSNDIKSRVTGDESGAIGRLPSVHAPTYQQAANSPDMLTQPIQRALRMLQREASG
jgi:hypothetical protein